MYYKCDICGREVKHKYYAKGYVLCSKHRNQLNRNGRFLDDCPRTTADLNSFSVIGDIAVFDLYDPHGYKKSEFIIDSEDVEKVKFRKWRTSHSYVVTGRPYVKGDCKQLAHVVLGISADSTNLVVDHINGNTLDNRKSNLRVIPQGKNVLNKKSAGVWWRDNRHRWVGEIRYENRRFCREFKFKEEALYWRYLMERKFFKEYRRVTDFEDIMLALFKTIPESQRKIIEKSVQSA